LSLRIGIGETCLQGRNKIEKDGLQVLKEKKTVRTSHKKGGVFLEMERVEPECLITLGMRKIFSVARTCTRGGKSKHRRKGEIAKGGKDEYQVSKGTRGLSIEEGVRKNYREPHREFLKEINKT